MRVPKYENQKSLQVVNQPVSRGTSQYPALYRAGQTITDIGSLLAERAEERKKQQNIADAANAYNAYVEQAIELKTEIEQRRGADARNSSVEYKEWHNEAMSKIAGEFTHNPDAERLFRTNAGKHYLSKIGTIAKHQADQERVYNKSVLARNLQNLEAEITDDPYATYETEEGEVSAIEDKIDFYHALAISLLGGAYTADQAGNIEAKIKADTITAMIAKDPSKVEPFLYRWKTDIGSKAYATYKKALKTEIEQQQVDTVYNLIQGMDIEKAEDFINSSGLHSDKKRTLINNVRSDYDRKQREIEKQQKEIVEQNDLDIIDAYYSNAPNVERDADTLAQGQQISEGTYKWLKAKIRTDEKAEENNPEIVADINDLIESKNFQAARESLSMALERGQIKGETFISMRKALASDNYALGLGVLNAYMRPKEFETDFNLKTKHALALEDYAKRVASGDDPLKSVADILGTYRPIKASGLPRPRYMKNDGDKTNLIHVTEARYETVQAFENGEISLDEYNFEIRNIQTLENALLDNQRYEQTQKDLDKTIKDLKIGKD